MSGSGRGMRSTQQQPPPRKRGLPNLESSEDAISMSSVDEGSIQRTTSRPRPQRRPTRSDADEETQPLFFPSQQTLIDAVASDGEDSASLFSSGARDRRSSVASSLLNTPQNSPPRQQNSRAPAPPQLDRLQAALSSHGRGPKLSDDSDDESTVAPGGFRQPSKSNPANSNSSSRQRRPSSRDSVSSKTSSVGVGGPVAWPPVPSPAASKRSERNLSQSSSQISSVSWPSLGSVPMGPVRQQMRNSSNGSAASSSSRTSTLSWKSNSNDPASKSKRRKLSSSPEQQQQQQQQQQRFNRASLSSSPTPLAVRTSAQSRPSRPRKRVATAVGSNSSSSTSASSSSSSSSATSSESEDGTSNVSGSGGGSSFTTVTSQKELASRKRRFPTTPSPVHSSGRNHSQSSTPRTHHQESKSPSPSPCLSSPATPTMPGVPPSPSPSSPAATVTPRRKVGAGAGAGGRIVPSPTSSRPSGQVPPNKLARLGSSESDSGRSGQTRSTIRSRASPDAAQWKSDDSVSVPEYQCVCTPGTIKSMTMVNIMSHTYFSKSWSPTFNFIIGENGSGKSALLSGIVAGLGGKAFDTGRATSMRDIIRNGQTKAKIEIVLNNYPSKLYGDDIKIVRTLSREGSSRYQIRDSNKVLRSLGRQELNLVLSKLNIQVDNPLAILHQEMSRNFLRTKDPALLYGYFYRALLLSSCETLLKKSTADLQNAVSCLKSKKALLDDLRQKEQELKKQVELIEALRNGKHTLQQLENEYTWAVVKEFEEVYQNTSRELDIAVRRLEEASQDRAVILNRAKEVEDNQESFEEVWQTVSNSLVSKTGEYEKKRKEAHSVRMVMSEVSSKLKIASDQLVAYDNTLVNLRARVEEHRHNMENSYERKMRELDTKKQGINEKLQVYSGEMQELSTRHEQLVTTEEAAARTEEQCSFQLADIKRKIDEKKQELREFEKAKHTKYDVYGREITRLMEKIKSAKFIKQPRGPLGCCFTVKDEIWAPLVEFIMSSSLCSFAVDNQQDRNTLHRLIDEVYKDTGRGRMNPAIKRPSICLLPFGERRIDVRGGKAKCQYPTILDVIDIVDNDYVVYNWLIDTIRVERILLFKSSGEACDLMKNRNIVPRTCLRGYSLDAYLFYPDPNYKALVQPKLKPCRMLKVTQQDYSSVSTAEHLHGEIRMTEQEYHRVKDLHRQFQGHTQKAREELRQNNGEIRNLSTRQNQLKSELRTLETSVCNVPDIASWMDEIEATNERIAAKQQEKENLQRESKELEGKLDKTELRVVEEEIMGLQAKQNHLLEQKNSAELKIAELQRELRKKESVCTAMHKAKVEASKKHKDAEKSLKNKKDAALKICPCITELSGTAQELKARWETLNAELSKNQRKISQRDYVIRSYLNAKDIADKVEDEIQIMSLLIKLAQPKIKLQQDHFRRKMLEYGIAVRTCFRNLIKSRGYWGDLAMSHDEKTLMCFVSLDTTSESRAKRNLELKNGQQVVTSKKGIMEYASGMSGGERSFTTICFLIACWQLMDMPFYILDEFDVFMDTFNRRISQYILMNVAKSKPYAQFFVFTPLPLDTNPPPGTIILKLFKNRGEKSNEDQEDDERDNRKKLLRIKSH